MMSFGHRIRTILLLGLMALSMSPLASAQSAKITFRRIFSGSTPEFIEITVREDSEVATFEIRQLDEDAGSAPFNVSSVIRANMFVYAAELQHVQGQELDVHRKIAYLAEKTIRWEQGNQKFENKFNYSLNP